MSIEVLMKNLEDMGVELWSENGSLKYRAPKGVMDKSLLSRIAEKKSEIISFTESKQDLSKEHIISSDPKNKYKPFPLTEVQRAYWVGRTDTYELGGVSTHFYLEIEGDINPDILNQSWNKMIVKHDMLRVVFTDDGFQKILEDVPEYRFKRYCANDEDDLLKIRKEMSHQVMPADTWPLFDIRTAMLPSGKHRVYIGFDCLMSDAWSQMTIFEDWVDTYIDPCKKMVGYDLTFRDYILAEEKFKGLNRYEKSKKYWLDRIHEMKQGPSLPLSMNPGMINKPEFIRHNYSLEPDKWKKIKKISTAMRVTPTCVLLSAFSHVLNSWSLDSQFTINMTLFNRLPVHEDINKIVGEFTSLNLLSVDMTERGTFQEKTSEIQEQLMKDLDHIHYSGVTLIRELIKEREEFKVGSLPVVFTSALGFNSGDEVVGIERLGNIVYSITQTPQVWLDFQVYENGGCLKFNWDTVKGLFNDDMLDDMFDSYCGILESLVEKDVWIKSIPNLTPEYQLEKREEINSTETAISSLMLHELFEKQAAVSPEKIAVSDMESRVSYGELAEASQKIAHFLFSKNIKPDQLVAIVIDKGWEQVAAVLGILKSGAAFLPIDTKIPNERLLHILKDANVGVVLTQQKFKANFSRDILLNYDCQELNEIYSEYKNNKISSTVQTKDNLAYVIYTSGSTGKPKGVMIDHRGAVNTILDINRRFNVTSGDKVLALSSLNFDLSIYDIFGMLAAGGTIVFPEPERIKDPSHWIDLIKKEKVTVWNSVPMFMQMLVESVDEQEIASSNLRLCLMSGDWIPNELPGKIKSLFKEVSVISLGGATEASIWSILYPINNPWFYSKSIPYGKPMKNQGFHVLNNKLESVPDWVTGKLYISGIGLAKGYWNDKEKTENAFITHPVTLEKLYNTGDLGRYLPDGNIEFLGREDFQVKINGYRVELGEIEDALSRYCGIKNSLVFLNETKASGQKYLMAYIVKESEDLMSPEDIKSFLSSYLPGYMIPHVYVFVSDFPLTQNGKVDRKALEKLCIDYSFEPGYNPPVTDTQKVISDIWVDLGVGKAGIDDDFFTVGGNSLLAVQAITKIRSRLTEKITLPHFFKYPTIRKLSHEIDSFKNCGSAGMLDQKKNIEELKEEAKLAFDAYNFPDKVKGGSFNKPKNIFLTGATGFLGCFLLHELICKTDATIYCLTRGSSKVEAENRIYDNLRKYFLWDEKQRERINAVVGDLSSKNFGMTEDEYRELSYSIDSIYNNAAITNFAYTYDTVKSVNVFGTAEVLRFAVQNKVKQFHHISTTSVFPYTNDAITEETSIEYNGFLSIGYPQSKWVSEKLVNLAKALGLPASIYRPGLISGHSVNGTANEDDAISRIISGCIQAGAVPELGMLVDFLPVDFISRSIVDLSLQAELLGKTFNLIHPNPVNTKDIINWAKELGFPLETVSFRDWLEIISNSENNALLPLIPVFPKELPKVLGPLKFNVNNTFLKIDCNKNKVPEINKSLLKIYLSNFA